MTTELWTVGQTADYFQVSMSTIRRWAALGEIPRPIKVGRRLRFRRAEIEAFIEQRQEHVSAGLSLTPR